MLFKALSQLLQIAAGRDRLIVGALDIDAHLEVIGQVIGVPVRRLDLDMVVPTDVFLQRLQKGGLRRLERGRNALGLCGNRHQLLANGLGQRAQQDGNFLFEQARY